MSKEYIRNFQSPLEYVQVIQTGENAFKVGKSSDPEKRKKQLQTGNPFHIELKASIPTLFSSCLELYFHKQYAENCISGEHYNLDLEKIIFALNEKNKEVSP